MVFRYARDTSRFVEEKIHRPEEKMVGTGYYECPALHFVFRCGVFAMKAWT